MDANGWDTSYDCVPTQMYIFDSYFTQGYLQWPPEQLEDDAAGYFVATEGAAADDSWMLHTNPDDQDGDYDNQGGGYSPVTKTGAQAILKLAVLATQRHDTVNLPWCMGPGYPTSVGSKVGLARVSALAGGEALDAYDCEGTWTQLGWGPITGTGGLKRSVSGLEMAAALQVIP
ncbi:hypothetical protein JKP88DRAFT_285913 [Tribonema minus]|uniref:Uncharacterized protein n=1 Tax=Tribonema minus TaxID=303371 RepID=A0A836CLC0_9STRA|nr:hypothetical protein JKP88DRAFT_285913 [Tribonema minus]